MITRGQRGQRVQHVRRTRRWRRPCRHHDLLEEATATADEQAHLERVQIALAGAPGIELRQPARGACHQRGSGAVARAGEGDAALQQLDPGQRELVQRRRLDRGEQRGGRLTDARVEVGLRRVQGALDPAAGVRRQDGRALQERGRGRHATACLGPCGALLELGRDVLVGADHGLGPMPRPAVRRHDRIGHPGQSAVSRPALARPGSPVDRRPGERMTEPDPRGELGQLHGGGLRAGAGDVDAQCPRGRPQQARVAGRVRAGEGQQQPGIAGQAGQPALEGQLDPGRHRRCLGQREASCPGQLEQRERIAARLGDEPVAHSFVQRQRALRGQQVLGDVVGQPAARAGAAHQLGDPTRLGLPADEQVGSPGECVHTGTVIDQCSTGTPDRCNLRLRPIDDVLRSRCVVRSWPRRRTGGAGRPSPSRTAPP